MAAVDLEVFTAEMFRKSPKVYVIGPKSCGKSELIKILTAAGWLQWTPRQISCVELKTFLCVPFLRNQYLILFKGADAFECGKSRLPEFCKQRLQLLCKYECLVYDVDGDKLYTPLFTSSFV